MATEKESANSLNLPSTLTVKNPTIQELTLIVQQHKSRQKGIPLALIAETSRGTYCEIIDNATKADDILSRIGKEKGLNNFVTMPGNVIIFTPKF